MVPLAVGTQTNGSVIRPAAFCGVYGYKPTAGLIAGAGVLRQSQSLDQIGVFARSVDDAALLAAQLMTQPPAGFATADSVAPPRLAFVRTPRWEDTTDDTRAAYDRLIDHLGDSVTGETMPAAAASAWDWHRTVMETEIAANFSAEWRDGRDRLSASLRGQIERGRVTPVADYQYALAQIPRVDALFADLYARYDAILTPAVAGTAPRGLGSTGDPAFCTLWTFCGMPAINVPLLRGANGLPLGVQLVGPRMGDARVLRAARWLAQFAPEFQ
jgi:Asp-tRNA(Asn)/Glu-tRNA(Gln) amidotransferase A subunit family amidase